MKNHGLNGINFEILFNCYKKAYFFNIWSFTNQNSFIQLRNYASTYKSIYLNRKMYYMSRQNWITSKYKYSIVLHKTNKTQKQHNRVEKNLKKNVYEKCFIIMLQNILWFLSCELLLVQKISWSLTILGPGHSSWPKHWLNYVK